MKKILKLIGIVLGAILVFILLFVTYIHFDGIPRYDVKKIDLKVEITPQRVAQGQKIASMECIACHAADDGKLTGRHMKEVSVFGTIYSRNITGDIEKGIGSWTDGELLYLLRTGIKRDGQYIPPYMPKFNSASDEDLYSVIAWLRSDKIAPSSEELPESEPSFLAKFLSHVAFKPLPYPEAVVAQPDTNNVVEHGRYLANAIYGCYPCHSADFKTMDDLVPERTSGFYGGGNKMIGLKGEMVTTANLTFDETGIAAYTAEEFTQAVKYNKKRDGTLLRYPMFPHNQLTDKEAVAIYEYLKTVPKISHKIERN
ncbi:MAG: cytochrome c [Bacteroidota bacterium]